MQERCLHLARRLANLPGVKGGRGGLMALTMSGQHWTYSAAQSESSQAGLDQACPLLMDHASARISPALFLSLHVCLLLFAEDCICLSVGEQHQRLDSDRLLKDSFSRYMELLQPAAYKGTMLSAVACQVRSSCSTIGDSSIWTDASRER